VARQTVKPYEVIVADNCSEDDTEAVAKSFPGVIYYRNERNLGLAGNSNRCIKLAKGEFVTILHSDDLISPCWHEYWLGVLSRYKEKKELGVFFSSVFTIDSNDRAKIVYRVLSRERLMEPGEAFKVMWSRNMCALPASGGIIFRKSIFSDIGEYVEELSTEADALLVLRILNKYAIFHSPRLIYAFRIHPFQTFDKIKQEKTIDKKLNVLGRHLNIFKDFYYNELKPEYRHPLFYKRVAFMYVAIAFFHLITFKKELAEKYYKLTKEIFSDLFNNPFDYLILASVIFHYIRKLVWGRILAIPIKRMACKWAQV
jgi:glycosyltransferase involved in cell wall biosynthesis